MCICCSFIGCMRKVTETVQDKNNIKKEETSQTVVNLSKVYQVPVSRKIYVNVPDYQEIESGFTKLYAIGRQINIAIQPEDMINQVRDTVNAMAQTVKNTK